jgi:hypothetical protein
MFESVSYILTFDKSYIYTFSRYIYAYFLFSYIGSHTRMRRTMIAGFLLWLAYEIYLLNK